MKTDVWWVSVASRPVSAYPRQSEAPVMSVPAAPPISHASFAVRGNDGWEMTKSENAWSNQGELLTVHMKVCRLFGNRGDTQISLQTDSISLGNSLPASVRQSSCAFTVILLPAFKNPTFSDCLFSIGRLIAMCISQLWPAGFCIRSLSFVWHMLKHSNKRQQRGKNTFRDLNFISSSIFFMTVLLTVSILKGRDRTWAIWQQNIWLGLYNISAMRLMTGFYSAETALCNLRLTEHCEWTTRFSMSSRKHMGDLGVAQSGSLVHIYVL